MVGVGDGCAVCVSTTEVLTIAIAVSMAIVGPVFGVDCEPTQDVNIAARNMEVIVLLMVFTYFLPLLLSKYDNLPYSLHIAIVHFILLQ